ncbi:bifunctional 2-polyprenyl-6-hydroxyphenol methylase/3-demethylubiquinol 3-O-methyltransferase UbiG [Streptomyces zagrosensis]|uniref:2-polyprenyl-6-hydroxyphenyl methylase/3-demethylubiquinone-9 3-methyltransferase n=1 Tax=Streptomyces zagrosensis TaxID=1042984 RepID=A0A7W9QEE0_9ACTN|nr:bifunctional 2-polyprenyl-6-hydroxyphenol methylase/3-demethylubiquinol 3-O-methyltransferase UbiG [Streptomyces zagrosensis]MBB5938753.1 2-polyprenyl-6-hydroxyphenyl methylase/3-demethylubiquinone-9 3-methyltransferase [Streptomyces zagrosensis]
MPVDNDVYDNLSWWDDNQPFATLEAFTPPRFDYFHDVLTNRLRLDLTGLRVLDIGCGGGLLAERFAQTGAHITGVDPSGPSLESAAEHAREQGLDIQYQQGFAEELKFPDASFDLVYCCDTLEHVTDTNRAISEAVRVLKPGGYYLYDTINRTFRSRLGMIKMAQDWKPVRFAPKDLHDYKSFIKPAELHALFRAHGLDNKDLVGFASPRPPLELLRAMRSRARGEITYGELGRRFQLEAGKDTSVIYGGYAKKVAR